MSSIFKKLSVLFCCLFCLVSLNSVVSAKPGDYLVYFLGNGEDALKCENCQNSLLDRSGQFCCLKHCHLCAKDNIPGSMTYGCKCGVNNVVYRLLEKHGPFCFINYENGGNFGNVFENAKKSSKLYCAYCMKKKLNGNFGGEIFVNIPLPPESKNVFDLSTLNDDAGSADICDDCDSWVKDEVKSAMPLLKLLHSFNAKSNA